ncbi:hypothetical protein [Teichococcus oryzae]|uniref:hypothetical protein n=1 Tax=Teichococcus oryzae TaxID=1608942 RepID=UPI0013763F75|nr:hypothetical protein [Pseudoroseomonas oryzae]
MTHEHDYDDGLVHSHSWATEPPTAPAGRGLKAVADAAAVPTPSTAYRDDQMDH